MRHLKSKRKLNKTSSHRKAMLANMAVASRVDSVSLSNDAPALMIATGLALRSFTDGDY